MKPTELISPGVKGVVRIKQEDAFGKELGGGGGGGGGREKDFSKIAWKGGMERKHEEARFIHT